MCKNSPTLVTAVFTLSAFVVALRVSCLGITGVVMFMSDFKLENFCGKFKYILYIFGMRNTKVHLEIGRYNN